MPVSRRLAIFSALTAEMLIGMSCTVSLRRDAVTTTSSSLAPSWAIAAAAPKPASGMEASATARASGVRPILYLPSCMLLSSWQGQLVSGFDNLPPVAAAARWAHRASPLTPVLILPRLCFYNSNLQAIYPGRYAHGVSLPRCGRRRPISRHCMHLRGAAQQRVAESPSSGRDGVSLRFAAVGATACGMWVTAGESA